MLVKNEGKYVYVLRTINKTERKESAQVIKARVIYPQCLRKKVSAENIR